MKNYISIRIGTFIMLLLSFTSCEEMMVGEMLDNSNENNFRVMWEKFDSHYGLFLVKDIDWDAVSASHLPLARAAKTEEELFSVLSSALSTLNDQHVNILTTNPSLGDYNSGHNGHIPAQEDYLFESVRDHYLIEYHEENENFGYGKLTEDIGYIHASSYNDNIAFFKKAMDKAMRALASTKKIVFDIRDHAGGSDNVSKYIAGRFATSKKLFMTSKKRNGPAHDNFENLIEWYVEPEGESQYTKPVILLTTSRTISAGETFLFAMRENDNVIHMGDTSAGAFTDAIVFQLLNGWAITVGVGDYRGADGKSYEGIGIAPHIYSINQKAEVLKGVDKTLEMAIGY
ncbi:S41 family peptidase [Algoriphagus antarcticus]|uniref:Tricorn protease-like protein n=1 Tax=Algoriphagus antarcticus TaxID=238540 RepID=A0A3E0DMV6_9BACT|nr:S41 family peptidase [Algoriphagus antarcticus]REG83411.1 tricorn protease-like protein [Algoriphagus antarcticus]